MISESGKRESHAAENRIQCLIVNSASLRFFDQYSAYVHNVEGIIDAISSVGTKEAMQMTHGASN